MRFSLKIIIGYATVCLLTVAMAVLFLYTFDRYQRSNHMIFFTEQIRSREQALQVALYAELQSIRGASPQPGSRPGAKGPGEHEEGTQPHR